MMSDSFPYRGANAADARRYALNGDEMVITCIRRVNHVPPNPAVVCTSLQFADDCWQRSRDDCLFRADRTSHEDQTGWGKFGWASDRLT